MRHATILVAILASHRLPAHRREQENPHDLGCATMRLGWIIPVLGVAALLGCADKPSGVSTSNDDVVTITTMILAPGMLGGLNEVDQVVGTVETLRDTYKVWVWQNGVVDTLNTGTSLFEITVVKALNDMGQILVETYGLLGCCTQVNQRNAVWQIGVGVTHQFSAEDSLSLVDINNNGQVVGNCVGALFRFHNGSVHTCPPDLGVMLDLESGAVLGLGFAVATRGANSINDVGQVIGTRPSESETGFREGIAVLWSNGVVQDLGTFTPLDINNRGDVVGSSRPFPMVNDERAVLWRDGVMHDLGTLSETNTSRPVAVNDLGQVLVQTWNLESGAKQDAFVWDDGTTRQLGLGCEFCRGGVFAASMNNRGQVTGWSTSSTDFGRHVIFWDDGVIHDLGRGEGFFINDLGHVVGNIFGNVVMWVVHVP